MSQPLTHLPSQRPNLFAMHVTHSSNHNSMTHSVSDLQDVYPMPELIPIKQQPVRMHFHEGLATK